MLILLDKDTSGKDFKELTRYLDNRGIEFYVWKDGRQRLVGMAGTLPQEELERFPFIEKVIEDYPPETDRLAAKKIEIRGRIVSRDSFTVIAGPCTIDSRDELYRTASALKDLGIDFLRGGAYKLRSSPHSYQGPGKEGLSYMKEVCAELGMISVSEVVSIEDLPLMQEHIDILIVGTRNMQNYRLLAALGETTKPVILKRGMSASIREWLLASEYISSRGNDQIILCERGIRTFENYTRNTLDISAIPAVQSISSYPVIIDPSHSSGRRELVKPLAWAAAAAGADGLIIECHHDPSRARCDAQQTIDVRQLEEIIAKLPRITELWDKK